MKKVKKLMLAVVLAGLVAGCGRSTPTLHVYNWADYMHPDLVAQFEEEFNCKVRIDTFDSNESMFARIRAGASGYDLIFPSSYMVRIMANHEMLQPLDHALIPNLANVDPAYLALAADPESKYSVPYMLSNAGLAYRADRVEDMEPSWGMLDREDLSGRMTMLNDMRETIGAALKFLGYSINTVNEQELEEARDVVIRWKRNLAKFENEQYKNGIASGEFLLVHGYNGDIMQVMEENEDVVYFVPREGVSIALDEMVIPMDAREVDLAHAFINFLHRPEVAAENTEYVYFLCPNQAAYPLIDEELLSDPSINLPPEILAKSEVIEDLGENNRLYSAMWDAIKAAK
jgi:spermidine/putrescine transport system substrate-binding protein